MNNILNFLLYIKMILTKYRIWNNFISYTKNPQEIQKNLLLKILKENSDTIFGKEYDFKNINSHKHFCKKVPVQSYEDLRKYIENQEKRKKPYLNKYQPIMYAKTSGTTGKPKYIPFFKNSIKRYKKAQQIFSYAQYKSIPNIYSGKILAIVSPAIEGNLETGTPFGSVSGLIHKSMPKIIQSKYVIPPEIFEMQNYEEKYYKISLLALANKNITLIASANPTSLIKISDTIVNKSSKLINDIKNGNSNENKANPKRALELENLKELTFSKIWPNLKAVTTWTGGSCAFFLSNLKKQLNKNTPIIELGYLSSEFRGSITLDVFKNLGVPAFNDNYYEFVEKEVWENKSKNNLNFLMLNQIENDKQYYIFVTTQNGLYRYNINDIIEVTGFFNKTPCIKFIQKGRGVTNITGEKLYESQLHKALNHIYKKFNLNPRFYIMLANPLKFRYYFYIQHQPIKNYDLSDILDKALINLNVEYKSKRESGRLKSIKIKFLKHGTYEKYKRYCINNGQREGQFKIINLLYFDKCKFDFKQYTYKND